MSQPSSKGRRVAVRCRAAQVLLAGGILVKQIAETQRQRRRTLYDLCISAICLTNIPAANSTCDACRAIRHATQGLFMLGAAMSAGGALGTMRFCCVVLGVLRVSRRTAGMTTGHGVSWPAFAGHDAEVLALTQFNCGRGGLARVTQRIGGSGLRAGPAVACHRRAWRDAAADRRAASWGDCPAPPASLSAAR